MSADLPHIGSRMGAVRHHGRRCGTYARELGGGLYANVVDGSVTGLGIEPTGEWLVHRDGRMEQLDIRRRLSLAWAAPIAGAAIGGAAIAAGVTAGVVRRHRRAA